MITLFLLLVPFLLTQISQSSVPYFARFKLTSPGGIPPIALFTYSPAIPTPGEMITFDASRSYDLDGNVVSCRWNFGEGNITIVTDPIIVHSYSIDGNYTVELTVTDNNGLTSVATAVIQVSTEVFFRVVIYGTLTPLSDVNVTVYYESGSTWVTAPTGHHGSEVKYDSTTQPDLANTDAERYRNPGTTATILRHDASNIGFDIRPASTWKVFFKFQWGPYVAYWPNQTTRVYNYKDGEIESYDYISGHQAYWDSTASTYVIKANNIPGHGVAPTSYHPIIVGILAPQPPTKCYLTVRTNPSDVTTIPGEGWHTYGTDVVLMAPVTVSVSSNSRYNFTYWDVDGTPRGSGDNFITVTMKANHTATAHYITQYTAVFGESGLSDATGAVVTVDGASKTLGDLPFTKWINGGDSVTYSYNTLINGSAPGKRFRLDRVGGPASPIVVTGPVIVIGNYITQYSVSFMQTGLDATAAGSVLTIDGVDKIYAQLPDATWVDSGSSFTYAYNDIVLSSVSGKRFTLIGVDGPSSPIVVTSSVTATGNYKIQYLVTFDQTGIGSDFTGTVVTVDSVNLSVNMLPNSAWLDSGSSYFFSFASPLTVDAKQYVWSSTSGLSSLQSGTLVIAGSGSVIGNYTVQSQVTFQITFDQIGVSSDFTGAIVVVDDISYGYYDLPAAFLWNEGSVHNFAFRSPLVVGVDSKRYVWNSTSGLSDVQSGSVTVASNGSVVGGYETQYYLTLATDSLPPIGEGWYDNGTFASISAPQYGDIVPGSSRYRFIDWTTTDLSEITDPQSPSTTVFMDAPKTVRANYIIQYAVTFDQSGVGSDFTGAVVLVDGVNYSCSGLPVSFWWDQDSTHTFSYGSPLVVTLDAKKYAWSSTIGLSNQQSESITMTTYGSITGNYKTQYYLTVASALDSPNPISGWFDSRANITTSVTSPVSGPTETQYVCTGWTGSGSVPPSGTVSSVTFSITSPSSITWAWKTQYYLTVRTVPSGVAVISGEGWCDISTIVPLSAPSVSGYNFEYWDVDGNAQGANATSITVTMNAPHIATAHYSKLAAAPVGGRSIAFLKSTPTSLISIYVLLIALFSAVLILTRQKRK